MYSDLIANENLASVGITRLRVNRLLLTQTGSYNQMYHRPFELDVSNQSLAALGNVIENSINGTGYKSNIDASELASSVPGILRPSSLPQSDIEIVNGWGNDRFRYILEVEVEIRGSYMVYFIQGYTEFADPSFSGLIDPEMVFYINSIISVTRTYMTDGSCRDIVHDNDSLLYVDADTYDPVGVGMHAYVIRPNDVFTGLESSFVGANISDNYMTDNNELVDTRCMLHYDPKPSNRQNLLSSQYVASVINAQTVSQNLCEIGASSEDMMAKAKAITGETNLATNPFIRLLAMNKRQTVTNMFTMNELLDLEPNMEEVTNVALQDSQGASVLHQEGMTEYLDGSNIETITATIVCNAVTAIMSKYLLGSIEFTTTNKTMDGKPATMVGRSNSLINADIRAYVASFVESFELETMNEISNGNTMQVELSVKADLYKDVWISISINNGPMIDYVLPVYCDSLMSPVIAKNMNSYFGIVQDFDSLLGQFN